MWSKLMQLKYWVWLQKNFLKGYLQYLAISQKVRKALQICEYLNFSKFYVRNKEPYNIETF